MGALMRAKRWSETSLGPPEQWPQSLRSALSICLGSNLPMALWWGPDFVMLYNDAYRPLLGVTKDPGALGQCARDVWPELWHLLCPILEESVMGQGKAVEMADQRRLIEDNGALEERYFTFSYSPIRDESGHVGGVFCIATEMTTEAKTTQAVTTQAMGDVTKNADTRAPEAEVLAEAQAAKEFVDKVLTGLNDHYVVFDHEWRYTYANDAAARTLGLPKEKLLGNVIWELFPDAVGNHFYQELHRARDAREDISFEHYYQQWDAWYENRIYVLPDGVSVLSIDITARKRAEETQRQSEQMLAFALQSANMVAWQWDIERDLITFSNPDNHIYGTSPS